MFNKITECISQAFQALPDYRKASNGTKYEVSDAALSAFSVFFMQAPSFLAQQQEMKRLQPRTQLRSWLALSFHDFDSLQLARLSLPYLA